MRIKIVLILAIVMLAGCTQKTYNNITTDQLKEMKTSEDVFLIDVHIPEQEHIEGTDAFIPFNEITEKLGEIPKNKKIVLYCRSGSMSETASEALVEEGYDVYNLLGGANAWRQKGYEFEVKK